MAEDIKVFKPNSFSPIKSGNQFSPDSQNGSPFPPQVIAQDVEGISLNTIIRKILGRFSFGAVGAITDKNGKVVMDKEGIYLNGNSGGATGGTGSAGAGKQYVTLSINGVTYKLLHDGTV